MAGLFGLLFLSSAALGQVEELEFATVEVPRDDLVRSIIVEGNQRYTDAQVIAALGQPLDAPLDANTISEGLHVLGEAFHVRASVDVREVEGGLELRLSIVELPYDLEPRFIGNVEVSDEELREWAKLDETSELFLYMAPRVRARLIEAYKRHGYHFIEMKEGIREGGVDSEGNVFASDVIFEIREGPQVHVRDVVIEGNESMPDRGFLLWKDGLRKFAAVQLAGPRLFFFKDEFDRETLDGDLQAMRQVYRDRGWMDAIVQLSELEFSEDREWVTVHIGIDEGPHYTVGSLAIEGIERVWPGQPGAPPSERKIDLISSEQQLLELCKLKPGEFFEQRLLRLDRGALGDHFGEQGYIYHESLPELDRFEFLEPQLVFDEGEPVVHVTYRLAQGRQQFVREVLVRGNTNTADRVIRGRITVAPGEVADLTEISRSRSRIRSLGFFSDQRPNVEHTDPYFRFLATDDPAWKDIEYVVEETNALNFSASGGISTSTGLFGVIKLQKQNFDLFDLPGSPSAILGEVGSGRAFHGAGQKLSLILAPGTQTSSFEVRFTEPDVFRRHTDRIGFDLLARRRLRIYESHDERREEYGLGLRYQISPDSTLRAGFTQGEVRIDELDPGGEPTLGDPLTVPALLKDQEGTTDLAWVDMRFDHSSLDDYFYPQNGQTFGLGAQVYDESLGSDYSFLKLTGDWSYLSQFGRESFDARPGFKIGLTGGVAIPFGDTDAVPYSERFFLGGQRSLRGFDFRGVGPNEKGYPKGGETFLAVSAEYRQPLIKTIQPGTFREIEVIRGGFFLDTGVLDEDPWGLSQDEIRASTGVFLGLSYPLAFTLSYGIPLLEGDGDDTRPIQFRIGF